MKAYITGCKSSFEGYQDILWANNSKEAMKLAQDLNVNDDKESYIDVYVHRYPNFDDMENLPKDELKIKQLEEGWWFSE